MILIIEKRWERENHGTGVDIRCGDLPLAHHGSHQSDNVREREPRAMKFRAV
jgi:hypothetical protein